MFAAKVHFGLGPNSISAVSETAEELLSCWYKNGQLLSSHWVLVDAGGAVEAYVAIPEQDSLERVHNNRYATEALAKFGEQGLPAPEPSTLGAMPGMDFACNCKSPSALVLCTQYLSIAPPVRCLDCFCPIPLYRLPFTWDEEHLDLLHWAGDYRACDMLQMHCTTGERFGEAQLFRHDSSLSQQGRELCRDLEKLLKKPVYYWLLRMHGKSLKEEYNRRCPSCGRAWGLKERLWNLFDFQCKRCRLLSCVATDVL